MGLNNGTTNGTNENACYNHDVMQNEYQRKTLRPAEDWRNLDVIYFESGWRQNSTSTNLSSN